MKMDMSEISLIGKTAEDCVLDKEAVATEIKSLYEEGLRLGKELAVILFKIGEKLLLASMHLTPDDMKDWARALPFSENTARNYVKLYVFFSERFEELQDLTITQAYAIAGISGRKELPSPEGAEDEVLEGEEIHTAGLDERKAECKKEARKLFKLPTLSGCPLKKHRLFFNDRQLWSYTKTGDAMLLCDVVVPSVPALDEDFSVLKNTVQIEFEKYFLKAEEIEK